MAGCNIIKVTGGRDWIKFWRRIMLTLYFTFAGKEFVEYLCLFKRVIDDLVVVDNRRDVSILASVS